MTEQEKIEILISPDKFFPKDAYRGNLLGNKKFIEAVVNYTDVLRESAFWPREMLEDIRLKSFQKFIKKIANRSTFWKDYFEQYNFPLEKPTIKDLTRLPVLKRESLHTLGDQIYIEPKEEDLPIYTRHSSGTTGIPFKITYKERELVACSLPMRFRHPHLDTFSLKEFLSRKAIVTLGKPGAQHANKDDFFSETFSDLRAIDLEDAKIRKKIYDSIREVAPAFLMGFGSLIVKFAQVVAQDNITLPLMAVRITSEPVLPEERDIITKALGVPIINTFSSNGVIGVGFECPENQGVFHLNMERIVLEVVGEDGVPLPDGEEGELVITCFSHTLTPMVRYAVNDLGRVIPGPCSCGRTLPAFQFHGRRGFEAILPSGRRIKSMFLHRALTSINLHRRSKQMQLIQTSEESFRLLIVPKKSLSDSYELKIRLALTRLFLDEKINIEIECVNEVIQGRGSKPRIFIPLSEWEAIKN